jgi:expansin
MSSPAFALATTLLAASLLASASAQFNGSFSGDGTYYGESSGGNCALRAPRPAQYDGRIPVALNGPQYGQSGLCGACISGSGSGVGSGSTPISGSFEAFVDDLCPECKSGDLDFGMSGDGRWAISWKFVPCPSADTNLSFKFEGSNPYYYKVQILGTSSPPETVVIDGTDATRTMDNFFIATSSTGFAASVPIQVTTMLGQTYTTTLSLS